ncbi:hypothetical protein C8J56DRAFT_928346 [Mycena floridula]|nr:hypothetical protein C8J56DRAFT_928346 [Mycena floridula]
MNTTTIPSSDASPELSPPRLLTTPSVAVTGASPIPSPVEPRTPPPASDKSKGKRKAEEVEGGNTPPDVKKEKQHRATFAVQDPRPHRPSATSGSSSHAPSSYQRKRARLTGQTYSSTGSGVPESSPPSRPGSRTESYAQGANAGNTGSTASRASKHNSWGQNLFRSQSRSSHTQGRPPSRSGSSNHRQQHSSGSRRPPSLSQASIPISALISPHAPSITHRSSVFHMRDPRRPAPIQSTPWSLSFPDPGEGQSGFMSNWRLKSVVDRLRGRGDDKAVEREQVGWLEGGGSPIHAWLFFLGFVLFPVWWLAGFLVRIPKTRRLASGSVEKGVVLDDPQVEFDARSWRTRCRIMAAVSIFTYVPFIVLVAIFAPRR